MKKLTNHPGHWLGLLAAMLVMGSGSTWAAGWRAINSGLPGAVAGASGLAIDPTTPSTLYSWGSGLFKSTDGAESWSAVSGFVGASWLVVDPNNSAIIFAGTGRGLVKSADGGATWTFVNIAPVSLIAPLVFDPQDSNTLYAVTGSSGILKSTDGGASWNALPGSQALQPRFLTIDPVTPSTVYAISVAGGGIFKSTDRGENWRSIKTGRGVGFVEVVRTLAVDPASPSTVYAGAHLDTGPSSFEEIIYKSTDGGQNWRALRTNFPSGASVTSLTIDAGSPSRIYATYGSNSADGRWGIITSTDGGETWTVLNAGLPSGNFIGSAVVIAPNDPSTLYAGYADRGGTGIGGIVKSSDAGATWKPADAGRTLIDVGVLTVDPVDTDTIYASVGADGVFKSADGGANWTRLAVFQFSTTSFFSGRAYTRALLIDFLHPNILYAVASRIDGCYYMERLLFKSTDGGASWSDSVSPQMSGCVLAFSPLLVMDPSDSNTLYVAGNDLDSGAWLQKSTDGGGTWTTPSDFSGLGNSSEGITTLVASRTNPATLYAGTPSSIFKSTDGGATWTDLRLDKAVNLLVIDAANPAVVYAAAQGSYPGPTGFAGFFRSSDGGGTWIAINEGLSELIEARALITALVLDPTNSGVLYAGSAGFGVFRSTDCGATWSPFNEDLTSLDIRVLTVAGGTLYAGTSGGVFAISLSSPASDIGASLEAIYRFYTCSTWAAGRKSFRPAGTNGMGRLFTEPIGDPL